MLTSCSVSFIQQAADTGSAAGAQVPWLERPRVLQRSEGFRKTYDEQQAALMGSGDVGAEGYHRRPGARLLEDLKTKDVQRASVWEVGTSLPHAGGIRVGSHLLASTTRSRHALARVYDYQRACLF
jgi:hypothetical protein